MRSCLPLHPTLNHYSPLVHPSTLRPITLSVTDRLRGGRGHRRALNRATLARQLLLERAELAPLEAGASTSSASRRRCRTTRTRRSGRGSRASAPSRCRSCSSEREVVRIGVMRGTIHLLTADDCLLLRPLDAAGLRGPALASPRPSRRSCAASTSSRCRRARPSVALERPRTGPSCGRSSRRVSRSSTRRRSRTRARCGWRSCRCRRAGLWGRSAQVPVDDCRGVARTAARHRAVARRRRPALPRRVRACVGGRRDDVVPADRPAQGRRAAATAARHVPGRARPRAVRPPDAPRPDPDTPAPRALPARVRQRPPLPRRPDAIRLETASAPRSTGVVVGWGARAPRRLRRGSGGRASAGLVVRHVPLEAGARRRRRRGSRLAASSARRRVVRLEPVSPLRPAPRRVSASAPRSDANASASGTSIPFASAYVSPAAKQSPAP